MFPKIKVLYGADVTGLRALNYFGKENVAYFCDSSEKKVGKVWGGVSCISRNELLAMKDQAEVIICSSHYEEILHDLENDGFNVIHPIGAVLVDSIRTDPNKFYLFSLGHIGETVSLCSFAKYLKEMKSIKHLVLVCKQGHKDIALMYDAIDECIVINEEEAILIDISSARYERICGSNYLIGNYKFLRDARAYFRNRLDALKTCILQIPTHCTPCDISGKFIIDTRNFFEENTNDVIVIAPYALAHNLLPEEFWERLVEKFVFLGYRVYTNTANGEKEIKGSRRFSLSLREMFSLGNKIKGLVSYRSGFSDFMSCNIELNHIVIYPSDDYIGSPCKRAFMTCDSRLNHTIASISADYMKWADVSLCGGSNRITNLLWNEKTEEMISKIVDVLNI